MSLRTIQRRKDPASGGLPRIVGPPMGYLNEPLPHQLTDDSGQGTDELKQFYCC